MIFNYNQNNEVVALLGAGSMGTAIVERIAANRTILLGDISEKALAAASEKLRFSGYAVETMKVDASDKNSIEAFAQKAASLGPVMYFINTAGASPHQTDPAHIINLDLIGSAYALDSFGKVMARGGAGILISSMTGYMLPAPLPQEVETALTVTESDKLAALDCLSDTAVPNSGYAYVLA